MAASNSCNDTDLGERVRASKDVAQILLEAFGTRFELWTYDDTWHRDTSNQEPSSVTEQSATSDERGYPEVAVLLEAKFVPNAPVVLPVLENENVVIFPVECRSGTQRAAVGFVPGKDAAHIERHARSVDLSIDRSVQLDEQRKQLDAYVEEVTTSLEELTWLRSLIEQIEYCDVSNTVESVAEGVLQPLRDLIRAESLALIPDNVAQRGNAGVGFALDRRCWSGPQKIATDAIRLLIERYGERGQTQPFINNQTAEIEAVVEGVSNFILLRVAKNDFEFGWLLALNRIEDDIVRDADLGYLPPQISEFEFGTVEATLVQAAAVMLATHARNVELFQDHADLVIGVIRSMVDALDAKDPYTCGHSDRVALMSRRIASQMDVDEQICEQLYMSGLLHDIGKIGVRDDVLGKPGKLTDEEFDQIKRHPVIGHDILKHLHQLSYALPGVLHHHESFDGTGYPHGLVGEEIPLFGRIIAVADAFDAMTSDRPYRSGMSFEKAEQIIKEGAGTQWDPQIVAAFLEASEELQAICTMFCGSAPAVDASPLRDAMSML